MPYKDRNKTYEAVRRYRERMNTEKRQEYNAKSRKYHHDRDTTMGKPHKRVYTNGGGVWKCALCGVTRENGVQLDIHHKDQDRHNNDFANLVCLCKQCHDDLHLKWRKRVIPRMVTQAIRNGTIDWMGGDIE